MDESSLSILRVKVLCMDKSNTIRCAPFEAYFNIYWWGMHIYSLDILSILNAIAKFYVDIESII